MSPAADRAMRYLLDTHLLLWLLASPQRVPKSVRVELQTLAESVSYSVASLWEVAIKSSLGRLSFDVETVIEHAQAGGFQRLGIEPSHVVAAQRLPWHHRDPFDRMLVAQSLVGPMLLLTVDRQLAAYGTTVRVI